MPDDDKKPKKPRFKERDDADVDADEDRPRKKKRADDDADEEDTPKKKRRDDDVDDDRPKKKRAADDGPRVEGSERTPVLMVVALLGSALALLGCCVGGGWYSFVLLAGGGDFGGGGVNDMEVVSVQRSVQTVNRITKTTTFKVTLRAKQNLSRDNLVVVVQPANGSPTQIAQFGGMDKGREWSGDVAFFGQEVTQADVWVERRTYVNDQRGVRISEIKSVK